MPRKLIKCFYEMACGGDRRPFSLDRAKHAGPHTSAWPLDLLAPAASLCVSVWETAFRSCAAAHSVRCAGGMAVSLPSSGCDGALTRPGNKGVHALVHTGPAYSRPGAKLSCEPQEAFRPFWLTCGQRQKTAM